MAGRPQRRARLLEQQAAERGDGPGTDLERSSGEGNGVWASFSDMTVEERRAAQAKGRETQKRRREQKRLAEEQAMLEAHREHTLEVIETRIDVMRSLRAKGVVIELDESGEPTGDRYFDATKLDKDERRDLLSVLEQVDKRAWGNYKGQLSVSGNVSVQHAMDAAHQRVLEATSRWDDEDVIDADVVDDELADDEDDLDDDSLDEDDEEE